MKSIWKYDVRVQDADQVFQVHQGATFVACGHTPATLPGCVSLWAMVDTTRPTENVALRVVGTGHPIEANETWVGTSIDPTSRFVWHVVQVF